ncbi:hypothetical protein EDD16DRAFT_1526800 [Pisolithus croceorrhizus]|nr:hypothetical protein EV401DRAFT_1895161 [Pisolithus croceorrhizus]KAI6099401.1 hypothetical protein EDD16DRAFT_1526800 [Pisolithus croceorrhizus]KAI6168261.1 hypothetical protein EDD17DRAFT_1503847 [Pisolithus thermaeus]
MPQGNEEGAPRFSGHPDDLIWFLEDVRELCMQASCLKDHEWARWSIYYLGIEEFERWRHLLHAETDWADFLKDATRLFSLLRCPTVCYSKRDLYDLVNKQKKVKINSYQALLNYRLCFTDIAAQLRISSQLSWIKKDDLFLEGFDQEFQGKILRRLKWNDRRQYVDDPWLTYQVAREAERLLEEGYHFELKEAHLARDQWSTQEAQYEAEMRESRAAMAEEQCQEPEKCSESARPGLKALQSSSSTSLEIQSLTHNSQNSLKLSKAPGEGLRSQVVKVDSIESSFECIEVTSCIAKGSLTAGLQGECLRGRLEEKGKGKVLGAKASVELEVTEAWGDSPVSQPKYLHPSSSPCTDIPPQNPSIEPQDAEDEQRANKRPVKAEAHALEVPKPTLEPRGDLCEVPERAGSVEVEETESGVEVEGQSKVVAWRKPPEAKIRRKTLKSVSWRIKEILPEFWRTHSSTGMDSESWSRDLHDESEHAYAAAVEINASLSQKSENCLFKGYEVYGRKVKAPHSGSHLKSQDTTDTVQEDAEASLCQGRSLKVARRPLLMQWACLHVPSLLLYGVPHRVFEATRLGIEPKQSPGPHWHSGQDLSLTLRVFMFFLGCTKVSEESDEHETPLRLVCLLWRVFSVFLEDTLWSSEPLSRPLLRSGNPALSHWTLTLVRGLMLSCFCEPMASIYEYLGHQERVKRWQSEAPP